MATTFSIEISKESGFLYARAVGCEGCASAPDTAIKGLVDALATKLGDLERASRHNALSDAGVKDMTLLRGIFRPQESLRSPATNVVCK